MTAPGRTILRRPIWLAGAVVAVLSAALFVRLGVWQLDRHAERRAFNATLAAAEEQPAVPLAAVAGSEDAEYRQATVSGRYVPGTTVLLQSRSYRGSSGFHVIDALDTGGGPLLAVDRGWVPLAVVEDPAQVASPAGGEVTLQARVRVPRRTGALSPARDGLPPRITSVDPAALAPLWGRAVADTYVELVGQDPAPPPGGPIPPDPPARGAGPHLAYAFQWFAFAVIAVAGFAVLAHRTARRPPAQERPATPARLG